MAGSLALMSTEPLEEPILAINNQWQVSYSRFIIYPSLSYTCSSLVPLSNNRRYCRRRGSWISSSSPTASLQLLNSHISSDVILSVCFRGKILEEHYVSKLHFTWPQVSCVSGYPPRGSRAVFVSYKDSAGEIQKFALRFSVITESETFIKALKDFLKDSTEIEPVIGDFQSEISSQSVLMSANRSPSRACEKESRAMIPIQTFSPQLPLNFNYEVVQELHAEETLLNQNYDVISSALPPSFASFLINFLFAMMVFCFFFQDILKGSSEIEPVNCDFRSEISSQSVIMSTNKSPSRACEEDSSIPTPIQTFSPQLHNTTSIQTFSPQLPSSLNYEVEQESHTEERPLNRDYGVISSAMPPSFASFLTNCCSEVKQAEVGAQQSSSEDIDLKSQIARYMEDSSFQEMLIKVEKVINEIGYDLML